MILDLSVTEVHGRPPLEDAAVALSPDDIDKILPRDRKRGTHSPGNIGSADREDRSALRISELQLVLALFHDRHRIGAAESWRPDRTPKKSLPVQFKKHAGGDHGGRLLRGSVTRRQRSVQWIESPPAAAAPEESIQWKARGGRGTVGGTGGDRERVREEKRFGGQKGGEFR